MQRARSMAMACAVLLATLGAGAAAARPPETSICEIIEHPRRFEGRVVRLRASLLGGFHHGWILIDGGCRGGLEFRTPSDSREGDGPVARWNTFMWFTWPEGFPFEGYERDMDYDIDIDLELVGVIRFYEKDVDDWSGSNWAAKSRFGPSRGTRPVPYIDVTTVESALFYRLTRPRYEMDR